MVTKFLLVLLVGLCAAQTQPRSPRIFKGKYDTNNEHRYFVSILKLGKDNSAAHICGGVIVDSRFILTAAHCVYNVDKNELLVRSGFREEEHPLLEKRIYHKVVKVMYPKDYHNSGCRSHQYDIAVLKVMRKFDLADDRNFQKAYLPEYDSDYESEPATFVGYGAEKFGVLPETNENDNSSKIIFKYPIKLKYFDTVVMPAEECKNDVNVIVTNDNICTQPKNIDGFSCVGDSGSPLLVDGVVIGIRNNHSECIQNQPELFTRVSSQLGFIQKVLNREYSYGIAYF